METAPSRPESSSKARETPRRDIQNTVNKANAIDKAPNGPIAVMVLIRPAHAQVYADDIPDALNTASYRNAEVVLLRSPFDRRDSRYRDGSISWESPTKAPSLKGVEPRGAGAIIQNTR